MSESQGSFEVEIKYRVRGHELVRGFLERMGAEGGGVRELEDVYLAHPARDFAVTGEALRVRRSGDKNWVTYKGVKLAGPTKTREEIEIGFEPGPGRFEEMIGLYLRLGFGEVARIKKRREPFRVAVDGRPVEVVLDEVEGLGRFVEVEALARGAGELPAAQGAVIALGEELGLTEVEPRSYLRMVLEAGLNSAGGK
jgi:adenylate cyclase class 2